MSAPVQTVGVALISEDRVLLVEPGPASKHEQGVIGLPAGRLDPGETLAQGALRELTEETGLIVDPGDFVRLPRTYIADLPRRDGTKVTMTWTVFAASRFRGELSASAETRPFWAPRRQLGHMRLQLNVADAVQQAADLLNMTMTHDTRAGR